MSGIADLVIGNLGIIYLKIVVYIFIDVVVILYNSGCVNICVSGDVIVTQNLSCVCDINQSISAL